MSIGSAFNNAGSGLAASARLAELVSTNVANAMTDGYARRSTELSSLQLGGTGGGVRIVGTVRAESAQLTSERRLMEAATGSASTLGAARDRVLAAVGEPGESGSLAARATALEKALMAAAAAPSSSIKLDQVLEAARGLVDGVRNAAAEATQMQADAEAEIKRQVGVVNRALHDVAALNEKISVGARQGADVASLEDERARAIDRITGIVPVRTVKREGGAIALYTSSGGALLDGRAWDLSFQLSAPVITPETTLKGLYQDRGNGAESVAVEGPDALFGGGSLAALFQVRDTVATAMLNELDGFAQDVVDRFRSLSPDGEPGLFVDLADAGKEGLSSRLALNGRVDPEVPDGRVWRLRDGLAAEAEGPAGYGDHLQAMVDAMTQLRRPENMLSTGAGVTAAGLAGEIGAFFGAQAARSEDTRAYLAGQSAVLAEQEAGAVGVDTDAQLQFLMMVEQSYAANARVLTVIDSLMKQILEI